MTSIPQENLEEDDFLEEIKIVPRSVFQRSQYQEAWTKPMLIFVLKMPSSLTMKSNLDYFQNHKNIQSSHTAQPNYGETHQQEMKNFQKRVFGIN